MEFYKVTKQNDTWILEEEAGQAGAVLDNALLGQLALLLHSCYVQQERLTLHFRRYLTAYYSSGEMEYILLSEGQILADKPFLDGFATTWLDGEEEIRVWIGTDGAVENRGPSGAKVKTILELLLNGLTKKTNEIKL